jgi:ankyrin repeat protein
MMKNRIKRNAAFFILFFLLIPVISLLSQDIHELSKTGELKKIKALIEKEQELIEKKDDQGWSPLHHASFHGHNEVVEFFIANGAEINALDNAGCTPLHRAVLRGHIEVTKILFEAGAEINKISTFGSTPLAYAVRGNQKDVMEYLISKGADVNLRQGNGDAPLHMAAALNRNEIVELLLSNNADINIKRRYDITPLHFAAAGGHIETVEILIERGANINIKTRSGATPLHYALSCGHEEIVSLLVSKGADSAPRDYPKLSGEYLGMKKPGLSPELFAPGLLRGVFNPHSSLTFSPDGKEIYWTDSYFAHSSKIWFMKLENNRWTEPKVASFSNKYHHEGPFFSPDGSKLYFCSNRPIEKNGKPKNNLDIWFVKREKKGWGEPQNIGFPVNTDNTEEWVSVSQNGNLYFNIFFRDNENTGVDIYRSKLINGQYTKPEKLEGINSEHWDGTPYIAPDESYIIYWSGRPYGYSFDADLYINFRKKDGSWTHAVNLRKTINMGEAGSPGMSPDNKYFFFMNRTNGIDDFYWVDASAIKELKKKILK